MGFESNVIFDMTRQQTATLISNGMLLFFIFCLIFSFIIVFMNEDIFRGISFERT